MSQQLRAVVEHLASNTLKITATAGFYFETNFHNMLILHWRFDSKRQLNTKNSVSSFHSKVARLQEQGFVKITTKIIRWAHKQKLYQQFWSVFLKVFCLKNKKKTNSAHEILYFFSFDLSFFPIELLIQNFYSWRLPVYFSHQKTFCSFSFTFSSD